MATLNLGRIKPVFRGAYAGGTAYVVDDIVTSGNETFICILASTGNATSNATYWTKLAAKGTDGTNGTDVGTVITTQGDILYRDGSGLQRLAKGTASQVLQMNTSANAPEWADASGGYVLQEKVGMYHGNQTTSFTNTSPEWLGSINSTFSTASSISITPASASNKMEIYWQVPFGADEYGAFLLYREIGGSGGFSQLTGGKHVGNGNGDPYNLWTSKYWDAPNTTSQIIYRIYGLHNGGGAFNVNDVGHYNSVRAGIILSVKEVDGSKLTIST